MPYLVNTTTWVHIHKVDLTKENKGSCLIILLYLLASRVGCTQLKTRSRSCFNDPLVHWWKRSCIRSLSSSPPSNCVAACNWAPAYGATYQQLGCDQSFSELGTAKQIYNMI